MIKVSKDFILQEFVPEDAYKRLGPNALWLINPAIINAAQLIRSMFGKPMFINTWHTGLFGGHQWSWRGYRAANYTKCSPYSQHKLGNAIDFNIEGVSPLEVQEILSGSDKEIKRIGIKAMEIGTPTWTHIDVRNSSLPLIIVPYKVTKVVKPEGK